jgi:hypothetical protein
MAEVKKTIKERINELSEKYKIDSPTFPAEIMDLVERGAYPKNFCPSCQERMIYDPQKGYLLCINCGYEDVERPAVVPTPTSSAPARPIAQPGKIPAGVQKLIDDVPKETKIPVPRNPNRADRILQMKNKMEGGATTPLDDEIVRGQDSNIKGGINWS